MGLGLNAKYADEPTASSSDKPCGPGVYGIVADATFESTLCTLLEFKAVTT